MMNIKKYIGLALLPMVFTACQEDALVNDQAQGIYTLKATVDKAAPMSRAQVVLGGTSTTTETFHWNAGDKLTMFDFNDASNIVEHTFTIDSEYDGKSSSAKFSTDKALTVEKNYFAYYGSYVPIQTSLLKLYSASSRLTDNSEASWIKYFSSNMYMISAGTVSENMGIEMKHLCSLLRVTYTNATDEDVEISSVKTGGYLCIGYAYDVCDISKPGYAFSNNPGISFTNSVKVKSGDSEDFYILVFAYSKNNDENFTGLTSLNIESVDGNVMATPTMYKGEEFAITEFNPGSSYWFNITQTADGLVWTKDVNQGEEDDINVTFTNKELSKALYAVLGADKVSFDADSCALMSSVDVKAVTSLNFSWKDFTITSLEGIENFVNLDVLQCSSVGLKSCDLSKNPKIFYLDLSWNDLSSLDLSNQSGLQNLNCSFNDRLADLTLPITKDLYHLSVENTALESLDIYYPESIDALYYGNTKITPFDMSEFKKLTLLDVDNLGLNNLDLIPSTIKAQLEIFYCDDNNLSELDLSQFPMLGDLHCHHNDIKVLDLKSAPNLRSLMCMANQIDSLDISHWTYINYLAIGDQQSNKTLNLTMSADLKTEWDNNWSCSGENNNVNVVVAGTSDVVGNNITIRNAELSEALQAILGTDKVTIDSNTGYGIMKEEDVLAVTQLDFGYDKYKITSLSGIEHFTNLTSIECRSTGLTICDFSKNTKLTNVNVQNNALTSLDFSDCPELRTLICSYMESLTSLNLTGCTKLANIQAQTTGLTTLDIPNPEAMYNLLVPTLSSVDLNIFTNLTSLGVMNFNLTNLDFIPDSMKSRLTGLLCDGNELTTLDLSQYPNLTCLSCGNNRLTTLDVSVVPNMVELSCDGNHMTALDITSLTSLKILTCGYQTMNDPEGGNITLELTLTGAQKTLWDTNWSVDYSWGNGNVKLNVAGNAGGGTAEAE